MPKFRCPHCKQIYEGRLENCPHCGKKVAYKKPEGEEGEALPSEKRPSYLFPNERVEFKTKVIPMTHVLFSIIFFLGLAVALPLAILGQNGAIDFLAEKRFYWMYGVAGGCGLLWLIFLLFVFLYRSTLVLTNKRVINFKSGFFHVCAMLSDVNYAAYSIGRLHIATSGKKLRFWYVKAGLKMYHGISKHIAR